MNSDPVVEAGIASLRAALEAGALTSVELVARYLRRIAFYDRHGIALNAVPVLNPRMLAEAEASDRRRAAGAVLGPLDGIPFTAKDSYRVEGLTVAAGSPAFEHLVASSDAFAIGRLRAGGAVLIGLTTMAPMANGGMQRGVYGRAESPYSADYLPAAYASGSSNGSGAATAASFAAFGLAEETWSSGRSPASNNALVAYTPSRGVISVRGNWPLVPTMDVVVPHARSMADLFEVLDTVVADDAETRGDFWRVQPWVPIPAASSIRPASYTALGAAAATPTPLAGRRFGVPQMYINADPEKSTPIVTRESVMELWRAARADLERLGAEVVEVDFPVVENYERDRPGRLSMVDRGLVPAEYEEREIWDLSIWAWNDFLDANADPALPSLAAADGAKVFPRPAGQLADRWGEYDYDPGEYVERARRDGVPDLLAIPAMAEGVRGLEETRRVDFEQWLDRLGLDAVVFPAAADVGPADADVNEASADIAWRDGVWVSNGNLVPRHLGIPTVTVPMGLMADIRMPVGLTFAGRAYDDTALLTVAAAFEASGSRRTPPPRTPPLAFERPIAGPAAEETDPTGAAILTGLEARVEPLAGEFVEVVVSGTALADAELDVSVDGVPVPVERDGDDFAARARVPRIEHARRHSEWRDPYGSLVVAVARRGGAAQGRYAVAGGIA